MMVRVIGSGANGWSRPRPVSPLEHAAGALVPADLVMDRTFTSAAAAQRNCHSATQHPAPLCAPLSRFFCPALSGPIGP